MTLALYGKSRKRQGGLLLAALLAIIGAAVGGLLLLTTANAANTGSKAPSAVDAGATCTNASNAYGPGYVTCTNGQLAAYTTFAPGIPAGKVIDGIVVTYDQSTLDNDSTDAMKVAIWNGTSWTSDVQGTSAVDEGTSLLDAVTVGSNNDLWGLTWTSTTANAIKVRVTANTGGSGPQAMYLDNLKVKIYYSDPPLTGAVNTTTSDGTVQNGNTKYNAKCDVYLKANPSLSPDGTYYVRVTDTDGNPVLTPTPGYFVATVSGGKFVSYVGSGGTVNVANGVIPLCAIGTYNTTPNNGGEYKAWASTTTSFGNDDSKTDNFKVKDQGTVKVHKYVKQANGSYTEQTGAAAADWGFKLDGTSDYTTAPDTNVSVTVDAYTVTETTTKPGYTLKDIFIGQNTFGGFCCAPPSDHEDLQAIEFTFGESPCSVGPRSSGRQTSASIASDDFSGFFGPQTVHVCAFNDPIPTGTLIVKKNVTNTHGGTKGPGDFLIHVKSGSTDVSGSPAAGSATGTSYTLQAGSYTVSEDAVANYNQTGWGDACSTSNGVVSVAAGQTVTCTLNNADQAQQVTKRTVTVCKVMDDNSNGIPTEGGTFGFHVDDGSQTRDVNLTAKEGDAADAHCQTYEDVSALHAVTITESLPTNWDSAANYPTVTGASSVNGMTATLNAGTAPATVTFHNKLNVFSGACYVEGGTFLTTTGPFASTGYWFGLNTYDYFNGDGHNAGLPVDPNGATAGNAFDHRWVQVVDNGSGNKLVWKFASGQGSNSVVVYPSVDHNDAGGTTGGSIAGEANEYFVWGSNDGITWEQATGAAPFDPTPGAYIADNAARVFTFPGGHVWNMIGISVNLGANVGTDAEIDAVCGKAEGLTRTVTVKKIVEGADNDSTLFALNLDGSPSGKSVSETTDATFTLDQSEHSISEVVSTGYSYVTSYYTKSGECTDERILGQLQSLVSNILAFEDLADTSVKVPEGLDDYTVCFVNAKDPVVIVHKTWVGGSHTESDVPTITIKDSSQTYHPSVKTDGGNSTEWNSQTTNLGSILVSEDLGADSKWKVTASSNDCNLEQVAIESVEDLSSQTFQAGPGDVCNVYFTNTLKTGSIVVHKQITTTQPADSTTFSGTVNGSNSFAWGPITAGGSSTVSDVPVGSATVEENPSLNGWSRANSLYILSSGTEACPTDPAAYTATSVTVTDGGTAHVCVLNDQAAEQVKRTLRVGKVILGPNPDNTATFSGTVAPGGLNWSVKNGQVQSFTNLDANVYTVAETAKAGYTTLGYKVYYDGRESCPSTAPASYDGTNSAVVNLTPKEQTIGLVCVYNQPFGSITVTKTTTLNGLGDSTQAAGWKITVTSAACSYNQTQNTNASGVVAFTNLPTCNDYVVSEDVNSKGNSGFAPVGPSSYTGVSVTPGGNTTRAFTNNRNFNPCAFNNCTPVIINTPTTPSATPTTPTATATPPTQKPTEPTKTEEPKTPEPTKTSVVLGEKTPGANATPLAPQTGSGLFGTGKSGSNLLLAVLGLFSLSAGLVVITMANKNKSRS